MWRPARETDEAEIVRMCLAFYAEDPPDVPVAAANMQRTLAELRTHPVRGRALVAEVDGRLAGYALVVSFWSNEYGGEIADIDELFIEPHARGAGLGSALFGQLVRDRSLWPASPVALSLEVTPTNVRARALYERLGFVQRNALLRRRVQR